MNYPLKETTLANGSKIVCLSEQEAKFSYQEVQDYFKHGIELHEGDTVVDVGANIGIFTLWVSQFLKNQVTLYAFEPIPSIFEALRQNALRVNPENIHLFPCGLSEESKVMDFTYFPNATMLSSAYPDFSEKTRNQFKQMVLNNSQTALPPFLAWLRWIPSFLKPFVLDQVIRSSLNQAEQVICQIKTLSEVIAEQNIQEIDLLKVDVEKSELQVLLGIQEQDWQKIKQVFVEVHDVNSEKDQIVALLKANGFNQITVEQLPWLQGSKLFSLYALR
jgi:FkbM family methyltransferase